MLRWPTFFTASIRSTLNLAVTLVCVLNIVRISNFILDLWNLKCVFDFFVRKVRSALKVR